MAFLELSGVVKRYGHEAVVDGFTLGVEKGEFVSILGGSGGGKSTTLRMIAGFETPDEGRISIDGVDVRDLDPRKRGVGMVFQNYALFPNMTVRKNIEFGLKIAKWSPQDLRTRSGEMLELIHMGPLGDRYPHQLSGGQQQRVALARALAIRPRVLLLDEPLSALDARIRMHLRTEIREIQRRTGVTTLYVTHDQEEALALSDRVAVMHAGRIEQVDVPFEVYNRPATSYVANFIGTLNVLEGRVEDPPRGILSVQGQRVTAASPILAQAGQSVRLLLRPEALSLSTDRVELNALSGILEGISFLGATVRLTIRVGEHEVFIDQFNTPQLNLPRKGEELRLRFSREACLLDIPTSVK